MQKARLDESHYSVEYPLPKNSLISKEHLKHTIFKLNNSQDWTNFKLI